MNRIRRWRLRLLLRLLDMGVLEQVALHQQRERHQYIIRYPEHGPRQDDPHYVDFHHYHREHRATARCYVGERVGYDWCLDAQGKPAPAPTVGEQPGLELHHSHVEFALTNGISLTALEHDYPGISNPAEVGAWVESGKNFMWLCAAHHRSPIGAHSASHSDFSGSIYVPGLLQEAS